MITPCQSGFIKGDFELGLTSLYDRRRFHRLSLFYKILNQLTVPEYLRRLIPLSTRRLTCAICNNVVPTRTLKFRYSFSPDTSNSLSRLSSFIKTFSSLCVFQKRYMEFLMLALILCTHNPVGLKHSFTCWELCLHFSPGSSSSLCLAELEVRTSWMSLWVAMLRVIVLMLYL